MIYVQTERKSLGFKEWWFIFFFALLVVRCLHGDGDGDGGGSSDNTRSVGHDDAFPSLHGLL